MNDTDRWAAEAFILIWARISFMPEGKQKSSMAQFLLEAPESIKANAKEIQQARRVNALRRRRDIRNGY